MAHGFTIEGGFVGSMFSIDFFRYFVRIFWRKSKRIIWKCVCSFFVLLMALSIKDAPWTIWLKLGLVFLGAIVLITGWVDVYNIQ